nr:endonuclease/exonuclease/phosphatase family protein [Kribbella shirazensis]
MTIASLNTRGTPFFGSALRARYTAIADAFEASDADVVNLQEVHTYYHVRLLSRTMPSYRANFRPSAAGPAGGLVTFSRQVADGTSYRRFSRQPRLASALKGVLFTRLPDVTVLNTHLLANRDGDWSAENRYYPVHKSQLVTLTQYVETVEGPVILTGDFNIPRHSSLYRDFLQATQLTDSFGDSCPPTFHQAYLPAGRPAHCIDFALAAGLTVESAEVDGTFASDHLALLVRTGEGSV